MTELRPGFLLLFPIELGRPFTGFAPRVAGVEPAPAESSRAYLERFSLVESRLLGRAYVEAARTRRVPLGRISIGDTEDRLAPAHADVCLVAHISGVALWEAWVIAPAQPLDAARWSGWLDREAQDGIAARLARALQPATQSIGGGVAPEDCFPISIVRAPHAPLARVLDKQGEDFVRLLFVDRSGRRFKPETVAQELARDYCSREGGLTLLSRRSGLDLHGSEDASADDDPNLPPRSALPFVITVEQLLLERAVLRRLHGRLSHGMPASVDELLSLKQEVLDGLEEYYGAITAANRLSDEVAADGEQLFGILNLYEAVMDRLDAVSFAITTRYQKRMTLLQFWLTVVFGATEIGFIASGIAAWYYRSGLWMVLGWTVGSSLGAALILVLLLHKKVG
jgi:hypothetical protein